jgi:hypothetical protein
VDRVTREHFISLAFSSGSVEAMLRGVFLNAHYRSRLSTAHALTGKRMVGPLIPGAAHWEEIAPSDFVLQPL